MLDKKDQKQELTGRVIIGSAVVVPLSVVLTVMRASTPRQGSNIAF